MERPIVVPSDTVMRYAVHPSAVGTIKYIDGMQAHHIPLPKVGDVLNVPFLVHPDTRKPVPVVVLELQHLLHLTPPTIAIVVGRPH